MDALRQRPQAVKLPTCDDKMSKASFAPRNEQQMKASANAIQGANGLSQAGSGMQQCHPGSANLES